MWNLISRDITGVIIKKIIMNHLELHVYKLKTFQWLLKIGKQSRLNITPINMAPQITKDTVTICGHALQVYVQMLMREAKYNNTTMTQCRSRAGCMGNCSTCRGAIRKAYIGAIQIGNNERRREQKKSIAPGHTVSVILHNSYYEILIIFIV